MAKVIHKRKTIKRASPPLTPDRMSEIMLDVAAGRDTEYKTPAEKRFRTSHEAFAKKVGRMGGEIVFPHDFPSAD